MVKSRLGPGTWMNKIDASTKAISWLGNDTIPSSPIVAEGYREEVTPTRAPRVLIVDDAPSIRLLIRANLELADFDVAEVEDGVACLSHLAEADVLPDVITLDVMMPKQGGLATAAAIRSDPRTAGLGIVMVTTQNLPSDIARGERAGVDAYVTKPFDPDELVETVKAVAVQAAERR